MALELTQNSLLRYYIESGEHFTAVVMKDGMLYEVKNDGRQKKQYTVEEWLQSLPNHPTMDQITINVSVPPQKTLNPSEIITLGFNIKMVEKVEEKMKAQEKEEKEEKALEKVKEREEKALEKALEKAQEKIKKALEKAQEKEREKEKAREEREKIKQHNIMKANMLRTIENKIQIIKKTQCLIYKETERHQRRIQELYNKQKQHEKDVRDLRNALSC